VVRLLPFAGVAAALLAAAAPPPGRIVDRIAASVDEIAIPESEVGRAAAVSAMPRETGESDAAYRSRVLQALIDEKLEYEDARRFGPAPPDAAEVEDAMKKLRERLRSEGKDPDREFAAADLSVAEVRASLERQLLIRRYLQERFRPIAFADEDRAREEYEKVYVPERRAGGLPVEPFEQVQDTMRQRSQQRIFQDEVDKWLRELRQKARIVVYDRTPEWPAGTPRVIATMRPAAPATPTPAPGDRKRETGNGRRETGNGIGNRNM
jgi:parvulin-like peptidyl-prolyl isomerase